MKGLTIVKLGECLIFVLDLVLEMDGKSAGCLGKRLLELGGILLERDAIL